MTNKVQILNNTNHQVIGEIVVEDAYIHEKINDKYTFDFTCYEQANTNLLTKDALIGADEDYFRIASINISPIENKYEVSCEHISYELNALTPEEEEEEEQELFYEGFVWEIAREILEGTRFYWLPSDDVQGRFSFSTKAKGKRSRLIEFCKASGLEIHWRRFEVATQTRRGHDNGLEIELGQNLRDLKISKIFNMNGTVEQTYDIDFIDLNKLLDVNGNPLKPFEFHMGDTVRLKYKGETVIQRGVAVGYNPFKRSLPTIELEKPSRDIIQVIMDNKVAIEKVGSGGGGDSGTPPVSAIIYGVKIDETNSNPETAITYTDDAEGFTNARMNFTTNTFDFGSWEDKFPFNQIKPCLFKDGQVMGYLNPNNYAQFENGNTADITSGNSGDVMIEFPKIYWKIDRAGTDLFVKYSNVKVDQTYKALSHTRNGIEKNKIYIAAYLTNDISSKSHSLSGKTPKTYSTIQGFRNNAQANGYILTTYYNLLMTQILYLVMFKSLNSQTALGRGYVDGNSAVKVTGGANERGLFYGENTGKQQVKFCGIEDWFGNACYWVDGVFTNSNMDLLLCDKNTDFGTTSTYVNYEKILSGFVGGYVKTVQGNSNSGFIIKNDGGSATTYFSDFGMVSSNCYAYFGVGWNSGTQNGAFSLLINGASNASHADLSGRISYI